MESCKNFSKKYPVLLAVLAFCIMFALLKFMGKLPEFPLSFGVEECIMAVIVFIVTFIFMGKEKVSFSKAGFGYGFRVLRGYYIFLGVLAVFGTAYKILANALGLQDTSYQLIPFINVTLAGLFVGIVEEFIFRGLLFGGLVHKFGNEKKGIVIAAVISAVFFGVLHVIGPVLAGDVADIGAVATTVFKIIQCAIFGVILAFIYYITKNLYVVAALHSLDDYLLFLTAGAGSNGAADYVSSGDKAIVAVGAYIVYTLILVPFLVRCIRDITPGEALPFDDDFLPRTVEFVKKSKKNKKANKA